MAALKTLISGLTMALIFGAIMNACSPLNNWGLKKLDQANEKIERNPHVSNFIESIGG